MKRKPKKSSSHYCTELDKCQSRHGLSFRKFVAIKLITEEQMSEAISTERTRLNWAADALLSPGRAVFSLAIIAFGIETLVCARSAIFLYPQGSNPRFKVIPILPFLPAIPWLAYMFGPVLAACGAGLLSKRTMRTAAIALGSLLVLCTLVLEVPKYAAIPGSMSLRTVVFEPSQLAYSLGSYQAGTRRPVCLLARVATCSPYPSSCLE